MITWFACTPTMNDLIRFTIPQHTYNAQNLHLNPKALTLTPQSWESCMYVHLQV